MVNRLHIFELMIFCSSWWCLNSFFAAVLSPSAGYGATAYYTPGSGLHCTSSNPVYCFECVWLAEAASADSHLCHLCNTEAGPQQQQKAALVRLFVLHMWHTQL